MKLHNCSVCLDISDESIDETLKQKVTWTDLIKVPKHLQPTGPGGCRRGRHLGM